MTTKKEWLKKMEQATERLDKVTDFSKDTKVIAEQQAALENARKLMLDLNQLDKTDLETAAGLRKERDQFIEIYKEAYDTFDKATVARSAAVRGDVAGEKLEIAAKNAGATLRKGIQGLGASIKELYSSIVEEKNELLADNKEQVAATDIKAAETETETKEEKKDGKGFNWKELAGGIGGGLLGYMLGKMFGEGTIGKIAGIMLALGGFFMGRNFVEKHWGDKKDSAPSVPVHSRVTTPATAIPQAEVTQTMEAARQAAQKKTTETQVVAPLTNEQLLAAIEGYNAHAPAQNPKTLFPQQSDQYTPAITPRGQQGAGLVR